jgi:hypothetical protein
MGKKSRSQKSSVPQSGVVQASNLRPQILDSQISNFTLQTPDFTLKPRDPKRPRVLFAIGDADDGYTDSKIWRLARRLQEQTGWDVVCVTTDEKTAQEGAKLGLNIWMLNIESPGVSTDQRIVAAGELIDTTSELLIPGSDLHLWKLLALDDFVGSLLLFGAHPSCALDADLVIVPLMSVDNNSKGACGLYTWMVSQARQKGIPVLGLEVSPLGNKTTISHLPAAHYAVKSPWARDFLIRQGMAQSSQVSVLRWEEAYLLWAGQEEYTEAYLEKEAEARAILKTPPDRFVILITHHVNMLWEVRNILAALARVPEPFTVVIRVNPATFRRQYPERDIVLKTYHQEMSALPHVMIDERIGVGLLLQLADLVISPFAGTTTERASLCRKPTIICQAMGDEGQQGEFIYWEPNPERIPRLIQEWRETGWLNRTSLTQIVGKLLMEKQAGADQQEERAEFTL